MSNSTQFGDTTPTHDQRETRVTYTTHDAQVAQHAQAAQKMSTKVSITTTKTATQNHAKQLHCERHTPMPPMTQRPYRTITQMPKTLAPSRSPDLLRTDFVGIQED